MTTSADLLVQLTMSPPLARKLGNTIRTIAGVGTAQSGAANITVNAALLTTSGGQTAFVFPTTWEVGDTVMVFNTSSTAALIYPQSGGNINGGSTDASVSVAQNTGVEFLKASSTAWKAIASSASISGSFTTLSASSTLDVTGATTLGSTLAVTGQGTFTAGLNTKQSVANVGDTTPTAAELTSAFGDPATLGRGFVGTIDDNDGNTNGFIVWTSDASFYFLKGTKAT